MAKSVCYKCSSSDKDTLEKHLAEVEELAEYQEHQLSAVEQQFRAGQATGGDVQKAYHMLDKLDAEKDWILMKLEAIGRIEKRNAELAAGKAYDEEVF